jgi:hypothetical protein
MKHHLALSLCFLIWGASILQAQAVAQPTDSQNNAELTEMYNLDQKDRSEAVPDLMKRDDTRQVRLRQMLADGKVVSAADYYHAAMIFQHGQSPDDYLLAHTMAVIAIGKGKHDALWLAAATMDRFLQSSGKPQIFGTQFVGQNGKPGIEEAPIHADLLSDTIRNAHCVVTLAQQKQIVDTVNRGGAFGSSSIHPCP